MGPLETCSGKPSWLKHSDAGHETMQVGFQKTLVPLRYIEYGFGYIIIRSPHTTYSIYLRGTIGSRLGGPGEMGHTLGGSRGLGFRV